MSPDVILALISDLYAQAGQAQLRVAELEQENHMLKVKLKKFQPDPPADDK